MDKERFLLLAPRYYALAIATYFFQNRSAQRSKIIRSFREKDDLEDVDIFRLRDNALFTKGLEILALNNAIELIEDDFGPTIIVVADDFPSCWEKLTDQYPEPFQKYVRLGDDGYNWMLSALDKLNTIYDELGISDEDYNNADQEWSPLPLERESAALNTAIESVENVLVQAEQDNGYAVAFPEERNFVLDNLKQTLKRLRNDTHISIGYLQRNAFAPLLILGKRFAGAAIGAAASGAAAAIIAYIHSAGAEAVANVLRSMFGL